MSNNDMDTVDEQVDVDQVQEEVVSDTAEIIEEPASSENVETDNEAQSESDDLDLVVSEKAPKKGEPTEKQLEEALALLNKGEQRELTQIIEAALFASGKSLSIKQLLKLFEEDEGLPVALTFEVNKTLIQAIINQIEQAYADKGIVLMKVSTGYRFQAIESVGPWVSKLWEEKPQRYSRAFLETLAIIAYRQPLTRGEIEDIRGVAVSSNIIKSLYEREWIQSLGHKEVPGRPVLYGTTKQFLDDFNLTGLSDLPSLPEIKDLDQIEKLFGLEKVEKEAPEKTEQSNEMQSEDLDADASSDSEQVVDQENINTEDQSEENLQVQSEETSADQMDQEETTMEESADMVDEAVIEPEQVEQLLEEEAENPLTEFKD